MRGRIGLGWLAALTVATVVSLGGPASASQPSGATKARVAHLLKEVSAAEAKFHAEAATPAAFQALATSYMTLGTEIGQATCPGWATSTTNTAVSKCQSGWRWDGVAAGISFRILANTANEVANADIAGNTAELTSLTSQIDFQTKGLNHAITKLARDLGL